MNNNSKNFIFALVIVIIISLTIEAVKKHIPKNLNLVEYSEFKHNIKSIDYLNPDRMYLLWGWNEKIKNIYIGRDAPIYLTGNSYNSFGYSAGRKVTTNKNKQLIK